MSEPPHTPWHVRCCGSTDPSRRSRPAVMCALEIVRADAVYRVEQDYGFRIHAAPASAERTSMVAVHDERAV
jgi:hypothetical protein